MTNLYRSIDVTLVGNIDASVNIAHIAAIIVTEKVGSTIILGNGRELRCRDELPNLLEKIRLEAEDS